MKDLGYPPGYRILAEETNLQLYENTGRYNVCVCDVCDVCVWGGR